MAHFARLDENNVVVEIIVVHNNELLDENGKESELKGIAFCKTLFGEDTRWVQTSYNGNFRARYAVLEGEYKEDLDVFIAPKPSSNPSFVLDPLTTEWVPPLPRPTDGDYAWSELNVQWEPVPQPYPSWTLQGDPLMWTAPVPKPDDGVIYQWDEDILSWMPVTPPDSVEP